MSLIDYGTEEYWKIEINKLDELLDKIYGY